jgi:hypothetical protein
MSKRYASVDRSKEIKAKRIINPIFRHQNLVLNVNDFDINNLLNQAKPESLRTLNPKRFKVRKLPLINKQITSSHLGDINSKTSDLSTEVNNAFSFERDSIENNNVLKTEANKDNNNDDYYKIVINSDFRDKISNNKSHLNSGKVIEQKINIVNKIKEENNKIKYPPILKSERLYPKKNIDKNNINIRKAIKAIRNNHLFNKNNKNNFTTIKSIPDNIAYESKFENIVFDANKLLNKHNFKENDLKVNDNIDGFISQNKEMCLNNLLIKLIKKENKNLKENFDFRNKEIEKFKTTLSKDENDFEIYSVKQKNLYYKTSDLLNKIQTKNYTLIRIFYELKSKSKVLEDEIFKMIEQIESLRINAQFVSRVLGGNYKLFEGELIPDYENSNTPDIHELIQKVYDKYGNLLKKHKSSVTSNTYYTINIDKNKNNNDDLNSQEETIEEIETDILNDPLFMIRKYKDIEERILYFVEKDDIFTKNLNKEYENNKQILNDLQLRIINLQKELVYSEKGLDDFKNILYQKDFKNNENKDLFINIKDFCKYILDSFKKEEFIKKQQKNKNDNIDIFELNDEVSQCIDALIKKEREIDKYINNLESYECSDKKLFNEIMVKRRNELKFLNQNKNKENINSGDNKKIFKLYAKFNKIIVKSKKCEPPYYKMKKEVVIKQDPNEKINRENSELITYK